MKVAMLVAIMSTPHSKASFQQGRILNPKMKYMIGPIGLGRRFQNPNNEKATGRMTMLILRMNLVGYKRTEGLGSKMVMVGWRAPGQFVVELW